MSAVVLSCLSRKLCLNYRALKHYCLIKSLGAFCMRSFMETVRISVWTNPLGFKATVSMFFFRGKANESILLFSLTTEQIQLNFQFTRDAILYDLIACFSFLLIYLDPLFTSFSVAFLGENQL